jgi:GT2 family glycosyltransferase
MKSFNIAILIPVHNGISFTSKCLEKLYSIIDKETDSGTKFHIIVIDDGSTDGTHEMIKSAFPQTILLGGDGSLWWSGGINEGMRFALSQLRCDYVLWWNNDISPAPDYFSNLITILIAESPEIAGSKIYYAHEPTLVWSMGGIFDPGSGRKFMAGMNKTDSEELNKIHIADWLPGMGTILHKSVVEKIGMLDNYNFPQYHGDSDYTFRAHLAGYEIKVFPQLKIWNDKSNSGLWHQNSFKLMFRSLTDIKSNYHVGKDFLFYRMYATSIRAYQTLLIKYCLYIGGFAKWKLLNLLGVRKKDVSL